MLCRGFKEQLRDIFMLLPPSTQVAFVSATHPEEATMRSFMNAPIRIFVKRDELTLEGVKQYFVAVEKEADWLSDKKLTANLVVSPIHGELPMPNETTRSRSSAAARGVPCHHPRTPEQSRALRTSHRSRWPLQSKGWRRQPSEGRRHSNTTD